MFFGCAGPVDCCKGATRINARRRFRRALPHKHKSQPGGWLFAFEQDVRALWQAEVQVRLQPIMGLLEAARNENR